MRGHYIQQTWIWNPELYAPAKYRKACKYDAFVPHPLKAFDERLPADLLGTVSEAEVSVRSLNSQARPALKPLGRLLLRTESIASSKVEGLQVDARTLARAEANSETGKQPGSAVAEVIRNIDAMELAVDESSSAPLLTLGHITDIHRSLMSNPENAGIAGQIRDTQNWIGGNDHNPCGAAFVPPPPEEVQRLLTDLVDFANSDHLPPIIQAAVAHAQFETIHPFADGNGRTGRALTQIILRRRGTAPSYVPPISISLAADRAGYIQGLTDFRDGNTAAWIERFAVAAAQAATTASRYLTEVEALKQRWSEQLTDTASVRSDAAAWAIIDQLPGHPVITLPVATVATGRSKSSTAVGIDVLEAAGVLLPLSASRRNRAWEASGLLDLLADIDA